MYLALAGVVLFFALTRTQVGRDGIRRQLESAFNERFSGTLKIGSLEGTLLNDLQATNVRLHDEAGRVVASIDSVSTYPRWRHILTAQLSVQSITLFRPRASLHRNAEGTWNIERALTRRRGTSNGGDLDLALSNISIREGRITTSREGEAPPTVSDRWLFDYSRSEADQINVDAIVEWTDETSLLTLNSSHFRLPDQGLELRSGRVNLLKNGSEWRLEELSLALGNSEIEAHGTVEPSPRSAASSVMDLQLGESRLDHDELRRLVPRLPVRNTVTMEGRVGGSVDRLVLNQLHVTHDQSSVTLEGTAYGLPDSLDVEAQITDSQVRSTDVRSVWPETPLDRLDPVGPVQLEATVAGLVAWQDRSRPSFDIESTIAAQGESGAVRGSLDVQRSTSTPLRYNARLQTDSLNLAQLGARDRFESRLTGRVTVEGTGTALSTLSTEVNAQVSSSQIGPHSIAEGDLHVTVREETAKGSLTLRQSTGGELSLQGTIDATGPTPLYNVGASSTNLDIDPVHDSVPSTRLNATFTSQGRGRTWNSLAGSAHLSVSESTIRRGDSTDTLPPHEVTLDIAELSSTEPRLQLGGTIATASVGGTPLHPSIRTSSRVWARAFTRAYQRERSNASRHAPDSTVSVPSFPTSLQEQADRERAETEHETPLSLRGELAVHRMDLIRLWWPDAPKRADDLRTTTALTVGPDTLSIDGSIHASRLELGQQQLDTLDLSYQLAGPLEPSLLDALSASLSAQADSLKFGSRSLVAPSANFTLARRNGTLNAQAEGLGRTGPFRLTSDVTVRGAPTFQITNLYVGAGQHAWVTNAPGSVSLYSDAMVVDSLEMVSSRPLAETTQQIELQGAISEVASDTLYAEMTDVLLYPLAQLASLPQSLGGRLNGQVAMTGGWTQPQVRSSFDVHRLSFDRRVLGNLRGRTRLSPNTPDLQLTARLQPGPSSRDRLEGPPLVPKGPETIEENELQVDGRIRLPGFTNERNGPAASQPDQLDLTVDVQRADLFFFKYIFDEQLARARGYTAGTIDVGGHFRHPIFNADLEIVDAEFTLPQFGLAYTANGPVDVDREGIHLRDLSVVDDAGSANVRGSILFNNYDYFSFDLSADLDEITIVDVTDAEDLAFYGQIRASGPASLTGPLQNATLRSDGARTTPDSELFIPVSEGGVDSGTGFIVFADSTGTIPDLRTLTRRDNIFSDRPAGEPSFLDGLEIDINVLAPEESTVNLVFDPIVGDVMTAVGSGRIQLQRQEGEFFVYGNFNVSGGTYLFTAGEVFVRRFDINEGTITWDGPPTNAQLDLTAAYRTRASPAGLPGYSRDEGRIPVRVLLDVGGRVETPSVDLNLARVRDERNTLVGSQTLDAILNQADRSTEYATSVLLTNTFLLTTESFAQGQQTGSNNDASGSLADAGNQLAFNSVSQLVASQLNRYLGAALPNVDLNFGVQGESPNDLNDLDVIYGVALRLLNERLVIRGEGVYTGDSPSSRQAQRTEGEFVVEVRLSNRVSVEAFYRRSGDELTRGETLTSSTGAGVSYQTEFSTWRQLFGRVFGWLFPDADPPDEEDPPAPDPVAQREDPVSTEDTSRDETANPRK